MFDVLIAVFLPISLIVMMMGMGLDLKIRDFTNVFKYPKAAIIGLFCQLIGLPVLGYALLKIFSPSPEIAIGVMLLTFCPGGITSNVYTYLARADVGLSISLTAISGVLSPFSVPFLGALIIQDITGNSTTFELPILKTMGTLVVVVILPVIIGMVLRHFLPVFAKKAERPIKIFSIVALFAIIFAICFEVGAKLPEYIMLAGPITITLNVIGLTLGAVTAWALGLKRRQIVTIGTEVGLQNTTTTMLITKSILGSMAMTIAPGIYGLFMFLTGFIFIKIANNIFSHHDDPMGDQTDPETAAA